MIYLDYNATTPVDERVLEAMLPYFRQKFGNAASNTHAFGWAAAEAVAIAREQVAALIGASESEIIFTSGATESINLAMKGVAEAYTQKGNHIIIVKTEHKAVLDTATRLEFQGIQFTYLNVNAEGLVDLAELERMITPSTILVCVMLANNETGVIQPIAEISEIVHEKGSIVMSDCVQALGKIRVKVDELGIDLMPMSGHKMYAPKGVGALFVRRRNPRVRLIAQIEGGGHEKGLRSGTLNVPGIVGMGKAAQICDEKPYEEGEKLRILRDLLENAIQKMTNVRINGSLLHRLPNVSNISFENYKSEDILPKIRDLAVSSGSACTSALMSPSHVLLAMGLSEKAAYSSLRFSLGRFTTEKEIHLAIESLKKVFY
jgi:cysteine desulfurase